MALAEFLFGRPDHPEDNIHRFLGWTIAIGIMTIMGGPVFFAIAEGINATLNLGAAAVKSLIKASIDDEQQRNSRD